MKQYISLLLSLLLCVGLLIPASAEKTEVKYAQPAIAERE